MSRLFADPSRDVQGSGGAAFKALGSDALPPGTGKRGVPSANPFFSVYETGRCDTRISTYHHAAMMGPPATAMKSFVPGTAMRGGTAMQDPSMARPMTSNRGAGFTSAPNKKFDPLNRSMGSTLGATGGSTILATRKGEVTPEEQARTLEKTVHDLLEKSAADCVKGDMSSGELMCTYSCSD